VWRSLISHTRRCERYRRVIRIARLIAAAFVVLAIVAVAGFVAIRHLRPKVPTVLGSTTTEFVPTLPKPAPRLPGVAWATYGYGAARLRTGPMKLRPPLQRLWTFHGRGLLEFPPAVAYDRVYLPTFNGRFYALDVKTGRVIWRRSTGRCGWASPAVAAHVIYMTFIGSSECHHPRQGGQLDAYNARDGQLLWRREIGPSESSPLVSDGLVFVGTWNKTLLALDAHTGRMHWSAKLDGAVKGSVALAGRRLFIGTYGGSVYALGERTGHVLWRSGGHGRFYSSPAAAYGRVFIGSLDRGVYAFGQATGHLLWSRPTGGYVYASPAVAARLVLVGSYDHHFYALDAGTGRVRWRYDAKGPISGAASVIDGVVWFSTFAERTYALRVADGRVLQTWPDGKYSPAVADADRVYLTGEGRLYALTER
jgi:outer membrane protein assembly factor BamB